MVWEPAGWQPWEIWSCSLSPKDPFVVVIQSLSHVQLFCDSMDCSLPGSSVHGILQARILKKVAISFSRGSSQPRDWTLISCTAGEFFYCWTTREAPRICWKLLIKVSTSTFHFTLCLGPAGFNSTQAKSQVRRPRGKEPTLEVGLLHLLAVWPLFLFSCPHTYASTSHCPFDPWKTWVWTARVHLYMIFFNRKYYGTTWSMTGRIHVCRGTAYAEGQLWVTDGFLTAWRVGTPNPCEFDRLTVYVIESSLTMPQEFWLMEKNGWWAELWIAQGEGSLSSRGFLLIFQTPRVIDAVRRLLHRFSFLGLGNP